MTMTVEYDQPFLLDELEDFLVHFAEEDQERPNQDETTALLIEAFLRHSGAQDSTSEKWWNRGLCREVDPEAFYPEQGGSTAPAKRVCMKCPVRRECLDYALDTQEPYGVWGAMNTHDRAQILRERGETKMAKKLERTARLEAA